MSDADTAAAAAAWQMRAEHVASGTFRSVLSLPGIQLGELKVG